MRLYVACLFFVLGIVSASADDTNSLTGYYQTIIGIDVPASSENGVIRIGHGNVYLQIEPDGTATIHGASNRDEAVAAVLSGLKIVIGLNPYYRGGTDTNGAPILGGTK